jgi:hypothetical protein
MKRTLPLTGVEIAFCSAGGLPLLHLLILLRILSFLPNRASVRSYHRKTREIVDLEKSLTETLGTRVIIETNAEGGRLMIEFFSPDDLQQLVDALAAEKADSASAETPFRVYTQHSFLCLFFESCYNLFNRSCKKRMWMKWSSF